MQYFSFLEMWYDVSRLESIFKVSGGPYASHVQGMVVKDRKRRVAFRAHKPVSLCPA